MEADDKLKWLEGRINSSLRPRNEDLRNMLLNDENRLAFHEFLNNEDVRRLFVHMKSNRQILAALQPPHDLSSKSVFFLKSNAGIKLNKDNMDEEVMYFDCAQDALRQLDIVSREVYLPLLCTDTSYATNYGMSADKLMDVLHRLMASVETTQAHTEGEIMLPLPSIEVLAEAASSVTRRGAVLHVLETTVIGWIKQIKGILKHHPVDDLFRQSGPYPGPLDEEELWTTRLEKLHSINVQLDSAVAQDILRNLDEAQSTYAPSFQIVRKDITKAIQDTVENLRFLGTMSSWFQQLHVCTDPQEMLQLFAPLTHTLLLVWTHSKYYHQSDKFNNMLRLISNEVVHRAEAMVGEDVLHEPLDSYSKLKDALRVCAAFRGTYLDYRDKALELNDNNKQEHAEKLITRPQGPYTLFSTKMYGPNAYTPRFGADSSTVDEEEQIREEELWKDSPWPPRNAPAFDLLNSFMERCNDVLELVQTTRHFRLLADTAEIGGAGTQSLDALVREIHQKYTQAMEEFFTQVSNVLAIDGTQTFEKAFFSFRTVVKDLERKLAEVLRQSFYQCPTIGSQLRLLEVFEGISSRELVQLHLKDKDKQLVTAFTQELLQVSAMFKTDEKQPPEHKNMPPVVSKMLWVYGLKQRIEIPMNKMKTVSPHSLEGDLGWHLRDAYAEAMKDLDGFETRVLEEWQNCVTADLTERLKQPLLIAEDYDEDVEVRPQLIHVNLDPRLLLLLREIHYISQEPFNVYLPAPARELLRNTNNASLRMLATRLETIVSKYNTVMNMMTEFEQPLFERCLGKIDLLFQLGLQQFTWKTEESADFIETANALVCTDLHHNLDIVQTNCTEIMEITSAWSKRILDIFTARDSEKSYDIKDLVNMQNELNEEIELCIVPGGNRLHALLESSFQAVQISEASPAWQDYVDYVDAIVLDGLKQACLTSLKSMLNQIIKANMSEGDENFVPILTIRLELIENQVAFRPPLDQSTSYTSVYETVQQWLDAFLNRGKLVPMLGKKEVGYRDYISRDEETVLLVDNINRLVRDNAEECKELFELFTDYTFLWQQDVNQTFEEFLRGNTSPVIGDTPRPGPVSPSNLRAMASARSVFSRASSAKSSIESAGLVGTAERSFLTPKASKDFEANIPSLDEFDMEIDIYRSARDEIQALQEYQDVGWLRVDLQPIKQVLTTYASKWMWTYTKYLSDQVTTMLEKLDGFLKRIEPEIEGISGEERDTASFMKMMRLFNEVSAQQQEMDGKFAAMHRTVILVKKYGQKLPESTQKLFDGAPGRWNSLKTKVSLAKQRLGPRIQEESERITEDLAKFSERVDALQRELDGSDVYSRDCSIGDAWVTTDNYVKRLDVLENEAQDLIELQELLETNVVNFAILPTCRHDLNHLKEVWETVRIIDDQQVEWKRHRWQKMNTKFLREESNKQLEIINALPSDVYSWDVYMGLHESITTIQECLPLIDDLSNPAMRTRHWKQLVRVTGGAVQVDNDTLKRMTLGELLSLGLQKHVDDVRAIVQRAVKDLIIEQSLKTYEEVWLSKIFEVRQHVRNRLIAANAEKNAPAEPIGDTQSEISESASQQQGTAASKSQIRTTSRVSNQSSLGRTRRTSVSSLPHSLILIGEETNSLMLLVNTDAIFDELENHQVALQAMQSSSAAGSFLDEVIKWQKRLQTIEAVLTGWLEVQEKWRELEEVYSTQEIRNALSHDTNTFSMVNRDFRLLMKATEKNPNVLQCCQRKNILTILEKMNWNLDICRKSLLLHLERRCIKFPRFYFLSMEDVLHIICNGYDLAQVNLYMNKLFDNVGSLLYEEVDDTDKYQFQITGVCSVLGEKLPFRDPVPCEGHIDSWLPTFVAMIKSSLQYQLGVTLGTEKAAVTRDIHSAGSRRVSAKERSTTPHSTSREKLQSRSGSQAGSRHGNQDNAAETQEAAPVSHEGSHSWILDNVAEVIYLATQINLTNQTTDALSKLDGGEKDSLQAAIDKMNATLNATVVMLKGLEDNKDEQSRRSKAASAAGNDRSDTLSEEQSHVGSARSGRPASHHTSNPDLSSQQQPQSPVPDGSRPITATEGGEAKTGATMDTMDLGALPTSSNKHNSHHNHKKHIHASQLRLMLFPCQIQKISSLIALLAHQRELMARLQQRHLESNLPLVDDFLWKSQLQYFFADDSKKVTIKTMQYEFDYGFEYLGSASREVITPLTEKVFFSLTQSIKHHTGGLMVGAVGDGGLSSLKELSQCLGKALFVFNCTQKMDTGLLQDIFKGYAATGSWICFNNVNYIPEAVLSVLSQLLCTVTDAVRGSKSTVHLGNEEVPVHADVACFATLDSAIRVEASDPEKLFIFNSAASKLPRDLMAQLRTISLVKPDLKLMVEVLLLSQGFMNAAEQARKVIILYDMCRKMIGTNTPLANETNHLTYNCMDLANGWSRTSLKCISLEAGAILDSILQTQSIARDTEHVEPTEFIFGEDEKQDQEFSEKASVSRLDDLRSEESEALVTALRNTFMPRLKDRDASMFCQLLKDLWPEVNIPLSFDGQISVRSKESEPDDRSVSMTGSKSGSRNKSRNLTVQSNRKTYRDSLKLNTPVVQTATAMGDNMAQDDEDDKQALDNINDAIAIATSNLGLMPGAAFQARVSQLAQLNVVHKTIIVAGPAGCGKSECIKTFALAERERGKTVDIQSVYTKTYESQQLLGYVDSNTKVWRDGLIPSILRKFCLGSTRDNYETNATPVMKLMQLDGDFDAHQFELVESMLTGGSSVVLANREKITLPDALRFVWEIESLSNLSPSILGNVGVLSMTKEDVGWAMLLASWLEKHSESDCELLKSLCDNYITTIMDYLSEATKPPMFGKPDATGGHMKRMIYQSDEAMIITFTTILDALLTQFPNLSDVEIERMFNYSAIWAFGGTINAECRETFSSWWKQSFEQYIDYPDDGTVFDYVVDGETRMFAKWIDQVPAYSGTPHKGLPPDAFVHSVSNEQLLHLVGLLTDYGKPVMLVGENGCGKSAIVNERIRTVCSGEVAEVLGLTMQANRFTNGGLLYSRLNDLLEWKHGKTYIPRGNKRLLCFIDDINLAQTDDFHNQTAIELIRQHIDDGGFYNPSDHTWRYVKNVTYVTTVNPHPTAGVPRLSPRLLRHFAVFGSTYPSHCELQTIFCTLLQTHFMTPELSGADRAIHHLGIQDDKMQHEMREEEAALKSLLTLMVQVTLELQDKLRHMFLSTAERCHYVFSMRDISNIFRNICLSLEPGCSKDNLLLLWEHECHWVYGHRMINEVDYNRFTQSFMRAVRKDFPSEEYIHLLSNKEKPIFSSLVEQDSGLVTAGNIITNQANQPSEEKTDLYKPVYSVSDVKSLMEHGVEEYNKTHPRIKLALYRTVLEQVCRLARVMSSPHEVAHCVLVSEGCPGRTPILVNLAAHLCGYTVFKINPSPISSANEYKLDTFKADMVTAYTRAGVKGEKVLFQLEDDELTQEDFLVFLTEFIVSGSISHLFSQEEQTTIINSIRTEVTQAGLTYTRDVAWDFFLRTVKKNFRICFICSDSGSNFQQRCREYPSFTKNVNFIWFGHWTKRELIRHAAFHLKGLKWMSRIQKENVAHMLATMHLVIRQQDGHEQSCGEYKHLTNLTYEKFVERFISMACARHTEIQDTHQTMVRMMGQIQRENALANKLKRELEHERVVLEERKSGTIKILAQIGQDTAITEQQIKIVKAQMEKIHRLKKLLPEYQVAHERAVYKTVSIVSDTKKIVETIDLDSLSELRGMQKPVIDIEDLMAAIIMILKKNPQADLTWQKGAKRQMANLERFIEELLTFDEEVLPESTLVLVEPYLKKPTFDPESLQKKTSNSACASLCKWVRGVCRYHRMMISKVKPLHNKVEETTEAIDNAEHKMNILDNKRKALEVRLADLAKGFEEATIDKNEQDEKTNKMDKQLETAARLKKVLRREQNRIQQIIDSLPHRELSVFGGIAMASGLSSYLGPYHYNFRRVMLTIHWPNCLRERGVPLVIDSIDEIKGRVVDWNIDGLKTAEGAGNIGFSLETLDQDEEDEEELQEQEGELEPIKEENEDPMPENEEDDSEEKKDEGSEKNDQEEMEKSRPQSLRQQEEDQAEEEEYDDFEEYDGGNDKKGPDILGYDDMQDGTDSSIPLVTADQYNIYVKSLIKLMVGEDVMQDWLKKDFAGRNMENAAILYSSWQRPPMLIDPHGEGVSYLQWLNKKLNRKRLTTLDMDTRTDPQVIMAIEKAIIKGQPLLLENCAEKMDSLVTPIIQHRNTAMENSQDEEPRMIKYCGRRILCYPDFRLYMATTHPKPGFTATVASSTTLINFGSSNETITEELLMRTFARVRPELYKERRLALKNVHINSDALLQLWAHFKEQVHHATGDKHMLFDEKDVDAIADMTQKTVLMSQRLHDSRRLLEDLEALREELEPLARRAMKLYAILRSLACVHREYQFTLPYFIKLFDQAIQGEFPAEYTADSDDEDYADDETLSSTVEKRPTSRASANDNQSQIKDESYGDDFEKDETTSVQGSTTEGAADTEVKDEEKISLFELPEVPQLPSDGVEYTSLADNQIKQMIDQLTSLIYQHTHKSLYPEDRLLFTALLCLSIQAEGDHFTEEEMSLLLQGNPGLGMQLSLSDFDCKREPPAWLPSTKWEDIMAISVLPGPLDSMCVRMAEESEAWRTWYRSEKPETEPIPSGGDSQRGKQTEERSNQMTTPDLGPLSEFHLLLLLRLLRPDRLPVAMATYVSKHLNLNLEDQSQFSIEHVMESVSSHHVGVMVLAPPSPSQTNIHAVSSVGVTRSPAETIGELAKGQGVNVKVVTIGDGLETMIIDALETAEHDNHWVVIKHLHLASDKFFNELRILIQRMSRRRDPEKQSSKFCVWFTTEPCSRIPMDMLLILHQISWDALDSMATTTTGGMEDHGEEGGQDSSPMILEDGSLANVLVKAITSVFKCVPDSVWETTSSLQQNVKLAVYAMGVTHGLLVARQMFGARGLSQFYSLDGSKYIQAVENLVDMVTKSSDGEVRIEEICSMFSWGVYGQAVCNPWDKEYISTIADQIMSRITVCQSDTVQIGSVDIPVPPANVEPSEFGSWFINKTSDGLSTIGGLSLHGNVDREANDAIAVHFISMIDNLYEAQNMTLGNIHPVAPLHSMDMLRLRAILDNIVEAMPPLLELGTVPHNLIQAEYDFPYHRPSVISLATAQSVMMPESLGFVLLQECLWLNSLLCHVRQNIHELHNCLLSGPNSFPRELIETSRSIMEEFVPPSWVHPNCQPCTHSITSWLTDLKKRHGQMHGWVKRRMVPVFRDGRNTPESHGSLSDVWLGGLVNPQALLIALQQEKAVILGCQYDEIGLVAEVCGPDYHTIDNDVGLYLSDLHLQGGAWDMDANCLTEANHDLNQLPGIRIRPEELSTIGKVAKYHCPVFMNKARQVCAFYLDLDYPDQMKPWILAGTAIILDIGVPEDAAKKSRSFLIPKAGLSSVRSGYSQEEEEEYGYEEEENLATRETERSEGSVQSQSQLSYRPMSPQAPPLPPELQMTREPPMHNDDGPDPDQTMQSSHDVKFGSKENLSKTSKGSSSNRPDRSKDQRYGSKESLSKISSKSSSDRYGSKESLTKNPGKGQGSERGQGSEKGQGSERGQGSDRGRKEHHSSKESLNQKSVRSKDNGLGSRESLGGKSSKSKDDEKDSSKESLSKKSSKEVSGSRSSLNKGEPDRPVSRDSGKGEKRQTKDNSSERDSVRSRDSQPKNEGKSPQRKHSADSQGGASRTSDSSHSNQSQDPQTDDIIGRATGLL